MWLRKILQFIAWVVVGLFALYLFLILVLVPLVTPWAVKTYGPKAIRGEVSIRGIYINPFLFRLHLVGLRVADLSGRDLVRVDRLVVDVSFKQLLKKIVHVEDTELGGLFVEASLLKDGTIDLLSLVPPSPGGEAEMQVESTEKPSGEPLRIIVDQLRVTNSQIFFNDLTVTPEFKKKIEGLEIVVKGFATDPDAVTTISVKAVLDGKGMLNIQAAMKPFREPLEFETNLVLESYPLPVTSPYVGKFTSRALSDGQLDFSADYRIAGNKLNAFHKFLIQRFRFGERVESKDALNLPFGFAIALLEDPQGRINISLPVSGDLKDPQFKFTHLIGQTLRNFLVKVVTKPFSVLGSLVGGAGSETEELAYIRFVPGDSDLSSGELEKLLLLARGLKERPMLALEIIGTYDPKEDWNAVKARQFQNDYEMLSQESSKGEDWILQRLYERRFGVRRLWRLMKEHKTREGYDHAALNTAIRYQLSHDEHPDRGALEHLARTRAQKIHEHLLSEHVDPRRVRLGPVQESLASMGGISSQFTLTVSGE